MLLHERDRYVSRRLLLLALYDGKVRARGYAVDAYGEGAVEPLERAWFEVDEEQHVITEIDLDDNSMRHQRGWLPAHTQYKVWAGRRSRSCGRFDVDVTVYRLELAWEDLVKVWPKQEQTGLRRGRKRQFDRDKILREADADVAESGPPRSLKEWYDRVKKRLEDAGEPVPGYTLMMDLLGPKYQSFR